MAYTVRVCHGPPLYHVTIIPGPRLTGQLLPKQPESSQQKEEMWSVRSWLEYISAHFYPHLWPKWLTQPYLRPGAGRGLYKSHLEGWVGRNQITLSGLMLTQTREVPSPAGQQLVVVNSRSSHREPSSILFVKSTLHLLLCIFLFTPLLSFQLFLGMCSIYPRRPKVCQPITLKGTCRTQCEKDEDCLLTVTSPFPTIWGSFSQILKCQWSIAVFLKQLWF